MTQALIPETTRGYAKRPAARSLFFPLVALGLALLLLPGRAGAVELTLARVLLSTGGVGYFEYGATVEGNAELELTVPLDQVDDLLKSVVVYDDAGGVGQVRLPGREPLAQAFRDLPFGPGALESPAALFNSLQGAEIRTAGARSLQGRILRVTAETVVLPEGAGTTTLNRVSLVTDQGVQQFILEQAESVEFVEPELRAQLRRALDAIAGNRIQDRRTLSVVSQGQGRRQVRVGYVAAFPLWKASYRLNLAPHDSDRPARLRGWAHIDNLSGQDWNGVELTLISGNPVTFRQALYTAYFVDRPEVPVEVLGRILPRPDEGVVASSAIAGGQAGNIPLERRSDLGGALAQNALRDSLEKSASEAMMAPSASADELASGPGPAQLFAASADEATTQVIFRMPRPVTVAKGQSLMVPIVDREIPGTRLALYQPATHTLHPLASVRLTNDGETGLPPGSLTLYEADAAGAAVYLGDARLSVLPAGDTRLISFALDQKLRIDRESKGQQSLLKGKISKGILELAYAQEQTTLYRIKGAAREARRVVLEHPLQPGWTLKTPDPEKLERTESFYRIERDLPAGAETEIAVTFERPRFQSIQLTALSDEQLVVYSRSDALDPALRRAIARLGDLRQAVTLEQRALDQLLESRQQIFEEQKRIRDNLGRVPSNSDLYRRYLAKLDQQEDQLEQLLERIDAAQAARDAAQDALTEYVSSLEL